MRMLMKVSIPVEAGNEAIRNGTIGKVFQQFSERWHPEAAYFTALGGQRTAIFVVDLPQESDIPAIAEPFFLELQAVLEVGPAMTVEDLEKGLAALG